MAPVAQYVFAETPGISGRFTAGRHECLPYSVFPTFSKQTYKHQFVGLICQDNKKAHRKIRGMPSREAVLRTGPIHRPSVERGSGRRITIRSESI